MATYSSISCLGKLLEKGEWNTEKTDDLPNAGNKTFTFLITCLYSLKLEHIAEHKKILISTLRRICSIVVCIFQTS